MTDEELANAILEDRDNNSIIDDACYKRLKSHFWEYGREGKYAIDLLEIAWSLTVHA